MWLMAAVVYGAAECLVVLVSCPKKKKRGCRRLVIIRGRDGAATVSREKVSHTHEIMMGNDGGAPTQPSLPTLQWAVGAAVSTTCWHSEKLRAHA